MNTPSWVIGTRTDAGKKRRGEPNQDHLLVVETGGRPPLLIVADGMGGHAGGAAASRIVAETVARVYREAAQTTPLAGLLRQCLLAAHQAVRQAAEGDSNLASMGSTAVLAALEDSRLVVANVGDSRAYLLHGREMKQVSFDHSVVGDELRRGVISFLQALRHPKRNRLTQSISARRTSIDPYVAEHPLDPNDTVLLCTDGLWGVVTEAVTRAVALELEPAQAAEKLVTLANTSQAPDNVSVVVARRADAQVARLFAEDDQTNPGL